MMTRRLGSSVLVLALACGTAMARPDAGTTGAGDVLPKAKPTAKPEANPEAKPASPAPLDLDKVEKELKQLRAKYIRATKNAKIREIAYARIREQTDPAVFPLLLSIFGDEDDAVRAVLVDHLAAQKSVEADTNLARLSVFGVNQVVREQAAAKLGERYDQGKITVPYVVQQPLADALRTNNGDALVASAQVCNILNLVDAIPMLINAQAANVAAAGGGPVNGDAQPAIAALVVGQQEAFVSGLTPVVGDSAVGFNPQVSVLNTGTVLRIIDANVVTYRTEITYALGQLASRNWGGQSVTHLGSNPQAWMAWYREQFQPYQKAHAKSKPSEASAATGKQP